MLIRLRSALVCSISLLATALMAQTTINVGAGQPYTTIQAGIDAASDGDTVLVAPGTYYENVDFKGKAITLTSSGGAPNTTISGPNKTAAVLFMHGEKRASVLSNFTITAGGQYYLDLMGGVYVHNASPTILNNIITNTTCYGINSQYSSPLIQGNEISYVQAQPYECSFASGAGIWLFSQLSGINPVVLGNTIENNTQSGLEDAGGNGGAGIAVWGGTPIIQNNIIRNNATGKYSSPAGGGEGGGIFFEGGGTGLVANNLIYGNTSNLDGGGIAFHGFLGSAPNLTIINNTIVDNAVVPVTTYSQEVTGGQQLYFDAGQASAVTFANNVISGSTTGASVVCYDEPNSSITYLNNDFYNAAGPATGVASTGTCTYPAGTSGNISADPMFTSAATTNYHLRLASPVVDEGANSALQLTVPYGVALSTDLDGKPRTQDATGKGCIVDMGAYEYPGTQSICSTSETLTSSPNPSAFGQTVTFTAQLSSANGVPTGDVQFSDGSTVLATVAISSAGVSIFSTSQLSVGSHNITAVYQPTGIFAAATAAVTQVVNGYSTATALSCSASSISISQTAQLGAVVTSANGTPTGSVTFTDNGATLTTQTLASGAANFTYTGSTPGVHTLTATYVSTGAFAGSSASCSETVTALPSTSVLSVTPTSSTYGSPVKLTATVSPGNAFGTTTPSGTVTFYNGGSSLGTGTLANGVASLTLSTLPGGSDSLTCTYSGSSVYAASSCNTVPVLVSAAPTTTSLTITPNPAYVTQAVTMVATVAAQGTPVQPTSGSITFYDGTTSLGTQPVDASGAGTLTISTLAVGTHSISANSQPANCTFAASTSSVVNEVIRPSGFTIALAPSAIALPAGGSASVAIHLASVGNFAGPLSLSYGTLPADATASINPPAVTLTSGGTGSSTLTVNTLLKSASRGPNKPGSRSLPATFAAFAVIFIPLGIARRRNLRGVLAFALVAFALQTITGCTNSWYTAASVAPGTYQVPVIATDTNHNSQTATLTVTVTP